MVLLQGVIFLTSRPNVNKIKKRDQKIPTKTQVNK